MTVPSTKVVLLTRARDFHGAAAEPLAVSEPARQSTKYCGPVGVGVGDGLVGTADGDGDAEGLADGEALGDGDGLTEADGLADGAEDGEDEAVTDGLGDGDVAGLGLGLCADVTVAEVPPEPAERLTGTQAEMATRPVKARPAVASRARRCSTGVSLIPGVSEPPKT